MSDSNDNQNSEDTNLKQISAIGLVYEAVKRLSPDVAHSVLVYVNGMVAPHKKIYSHQKGSSSDPSSSETLGSDVSKNADLSPDGHDTDGINEVARKWLRRHQFSTEALSKLFSLGLDEIDLVVSKVPGSSKKQRLRNVFLLKGVAGYLASGQPRFTHEQAKQVSEHYDAWDKINSSTYIRTLSAEVGGTAASGYTLTARGLTEAVELIKSMIS